jgi:hypothetical protein
MLLNRLVDPARSSTKLLSLAEENGLGLTVDRFGLADPNAKEVKRTAKVQRFLLNHSSNDQDR